MLLFFQQNLSHICKLVILFLQHLPQLLEFTEFILLFRQLPAHYLQFIPSSLGYLFIIKQSLLHFLIFLLQDTVLSLYVKQMFAKIVHLSLVVIFFLPFASLFRLMDS